MKFEKPPPRKKNWLLVVLVVVGLLCGVGAGFFFLKGESPELPEIPIQPQEKPLPRMANLPPREEAVVPQPEYASDAPVLEQARKALREGIDPEGAVALAAALPDSPERADAAFLLLEYAAESGHGEAAFLVARYYDPTDEAPGGTIQKNARSAYGWYRTAVDSGYAAASARLERLKESVQEMADQGSWESKQLLKSWQ